MRASFTCLLCLFTLSSLCWAQERPAAPVEIRTLFDGAAERAGKRVLLQQIRIEGGQERARVDVPDSALLIMQLRAGELATIIRGERRERTEGEWWTVEQPSDMVLQTKDDSALIDTIVVID